MSLLLSDLPTWFRALCGGGFGLIIGSHLATIVIRWPTGESASGGRSRCDHCGVALGPADLVPLLSYIIRRGRCGACGGAIDRVHPATEAMAAGIGAMSLALLPGWACVAGAVFGWLLLTLAALDLRHFWLPNRLTLALALAALPFLLVVPPDWQERLIGGAAGYGALAVIAWGYRRTRGREGMGGGDPKLLGAIGLWIGWRALPLLLLGASMLGLAFALAGRIVGRDVTMDQRMPLGTLMAAVGWPLWMWLMLDGRLG